MAEVVVVVGTVNVAEAMQVGKRQARPARRQR